MRWATVDGSVEGLWQRWRAGAAGEGNSEAKLGRRGENNDGSGIEGEYGGPNVFLRRPICYIVLLWYLVVEDAVHRLRSICFARKSGELMLDAYAGRRNVHG